ncbi:MAG TPA: TIGR00730 family Rossman fold protein [Steroidobacteraceae bacterium]
MIRSVCVFCGSAPGSRPSYSRAAEEMGTALAKAGLTLVYGGGKLGLMGIVADAVLKAGGRVVGVIPRMLIERECAHPNLTSQHVVNTMHERKTLMADMSDAFVGLPGGMGTFDELVEIVTWAQLGLHAKPVILANIENYYAPLYAMLDNAVQEKFVTAESRGRWRNAESVPDVMRILEKEGLLKEGLSRDGSP